MEHSSNRQTRERRGSDRPVRRDAETLSGQSKIEFDDAKPFLAGLVTQNFANYAPNGYVVPLVRLEASGSGSANSSGEQLQRSCQVKIETFYDKLV